MGLSAGWAKGRYFSGFNGSRTVHTRFTHGSQNGSQMEKPTFFIKMHTRIKKLHIVNIGSVAGSYPYAGGNVYGGTKAFVKQFSLGLKSDLLGTKVKITNIEPGMANTEFSLVRFSGNKKKANDVYKKMTPLYGEDIAETILWSVNRPSHVNINRIEIMPLQQGFNFFAISRTGKIKK